jgi:hypothetical protein
MPRSGASARRAAEPGPLAEMRRRNVATFLSAPICAREGCGRAFEPRRGGKPQRFCSARCRWLAWEAQHPRASRSP